MPVVDGSIDDAETRRRYAHINDFERLLAETGTVVCKFLLHISKEEQRERLQARLDDPAKRWKFQRGDLDARTLLGRLPGRLRRADRRHRHAVGAVDGGPRRLEDAPQPDDRDRR